MTQTSNPAFTLSNPDDLYDPRSNGYSHVAEVTPGTRLLFIAGQGGEDAKGNLAPDFSQQAIQALANLETALASRGASLAQVFKLTLLIVDHDTERLRAWVMEANRIWAEGRQPVCTLIPVPRLALEGMLIEIDAVAAG